jgi:hypothetical protein
MLCKQPVYHALKNSTVIRLTLQLLKCVHKGNIVQPIQQLLPIVQLEHTIIELDLRALQNANHAFQVRFAILLV